ncbi:EAL and GGDEF domain-containing protein, partial [Loktanella sp. DJP18]|uniref:sensor domain-containing protein n=1 Tax=Loktanella sp. DJP18 TaxID=3409788 RepID=UPI003BB4A86A
EVIQSGKPKTDIEELILMASGQRKWIATSLFPMFCPLGDVVGVAGVNRDISEHRRMEEALAENSRLSFALEVSDQGIWDHNLNTGSAYFSPAWRRMRGIGLNDPIDPSREAWLERVHPNDRERLTFETNQQNMGQLHQNAFEYRERHQDGHYIWIMSRGKPVEIMADGSIARIIGTDTDISKIKEAEAKAAEAREQTYRRHLVGLQKAQKETDAARHLSETLSRQDALTGLPNRRVFAEMLDKAVFSAKFGEKKSSCVMLIDLDGFKPINDINGHAAGDKVLREIAKRLSSLVGSGDTVARLGGDEFAIILADLTPTVMVETASAFAAQIITSVRQPINIGHQTVEVGASIGMSVCPNDGTDSDTLLRAADIAMYRVKEQGRGDHLFFERQLENTLQERNALEQDVRQAVLQHNIYPHYQPLVLLTENRVVGFEILARWNRPAGGEVGPDVFIPIVEKLNLINQMTYDLLRRACIDARDWPAEITIALNISPIHFSDLLLTDKLLAILSETNFPPTRLEIEVTESTLVTNIDAARAALVLLQGVGIKISLDDFGTGYSSLYHLSELRFDKIKIDRSFISSMQSNSNGADIVRLVIDLASSLGLPVIAEGIEHVHEIQEIIDRGGKYGQGFYFSRAVPAAEAAIMTEGGSVRAKKAKPRDA